MVPIVSIVGSSGSGKTTLVKGLAKGLNIDPHDVSSPTFVIMNIYGTRRKLYHFDLYRLNDFKEIADIGYEEFLFGDGLAVVEWADKLKEGLPQECLKISIEHKEENRREISLLPQGERYRRLLDKIK